LAGFLKHHSGMWTLIRLWVGKFLNAIGVPGIVVSQTYDAAVTRAQVRVTIGSLFTVVSVRGVDIYFHRLTGRIDGIGFSPSAGCTPDEAH